MNEQPSRFLRSALRRLMRPARRTVMLELIREMVAAVREEGYNFSDVLYALAVYANHESSLDLNTRQTRATVAALLEEAAEAAETVGWELP